MVVVTAVCDVDCGIIARFLGFLRSGAWLRFDGWVSCLCDSVKALLMLLRCVILGAFSSFWKLVGCCRSCTVLYACMLFCAPRVFRWALGRFGKIIDHRISNRIFSLENVSSWNRVGSDVMRWMFVRLWDNLRHDCLRWGQQRIDADGGSLVISAWVHFLWRSLCLPVLRWSKNDSGTSLRFAGCARLLNGMCVRMLLPVRFLDGCFWSDKIVFVVVLGCVRLLISMVIGFLLLGCARFWYDISVVARIPLMAGAGFVMSRCAFRVISWLHLHLGSCCMRCFDRRTVDAKILLRI